MKKNSILYVFMVLIIVSCNSKKGESKELFMNIRKTDIVKMVVYDPDKGAYLTDTYDDINEMLNFVEAGISERNDDVKPLIGGGKSIVCYFEDDSIIMLTVHKDSLIINGGKSDTRLGFDSDYNVSSIGTMCNGWKKDEEWTLPDLDSVNYKKVECQNVE